METSCISPLLTYFNEAPRELILNAAVGEMQYKSPQVAILALGQLRQVNHMLKEKVDRYLIAFIPFPNTLDLESPEIIQKIRKLILKQFPSLKKWQYIDLKKWISMDPMVYRQSTGIGNHQFITKDHNENAELIVITKNQHLATFRNLADNTLRRLNFKDQVTTIHPGCDPPVVSSDKWTAIYNMGLGGCYISIIEIKTGNCLRNIPMKEDVLQLHFEKEFLYILCTDSKKTSMLRYDSRRWRKAPIELTLPAKGIERFYINKSEILFLCRHNEKDFQLYAMKREVSQSPTFEMTQIQTYKPIINKYDNDFYTLIPSSDSAEEMPSVILEKFNITNSEILKRCIVKLPIDFVEILDFCVQYDRIFVLTQSEDKKIGPSRLDISCYDLNSGKFLKSFSDSFNVSHNPFQLYPKLVSLPGQGVMLLYTKNSEFYLQGGINITDLNFEVPKMSQTPFIPNWD